MFIKLDPSPNGSNGNGTPASTPVATPTPIPNRVSPASLKPVQPSMPPAARLAMEFNVEQLPSLDNGTAVVEPQRTPTPKVELKKEEAPTIEQPKKEEVKAETPKEEKKDELPSFIKPPKSSEKKEEVETKKEEKKEEKEESGVVKMPSRSEDPFDYKGFNEEEVGILKPLSLNAREKVAKALKDAKEAKNSSYLQHPDAYSLTPEYKAAQTDVFYANKEAQFFAKQLEQCKLGKPVEVLKGWDEKGNPVIEGTLEPTDALEEKLRMAVQRSYGVAQDISGRMSNYATQFRNIIQQNTQGIKAERVKRFPWVADPKLLDYTIAVDGKEIPIKKIREDIIGLFPPYEKHLEAVQIVGDMMVGLIIKDAEIQSLKGSKQVEAVKTAEQEKVEPKSDNRPAPVSDLKFGKVREFSSVGAPEGL